MSVRAPRLPSRRRLAVVTVLGLALIGLVPSAAHAAETGGPTPDAAVSLPVADLNGSFVASNVGISSNGTRSVSAMPFWYNPGWFAFTPATSGTITVTTSEIGYDTALEIWTSSGAFVTQNDDDGSLASRVTAALVGGTPYLLGVGSYGYLYDGTHYSSTGSATVTVEWAPVPPSSPRDLSATAGDASIEVTWTEPADVSGGVLEYTVWCSPDGAAEVACAQLRADGATPPATSTTLTGLTNGVTYAVRVTARNPVGTSTPSAAATATPQAPSATTITVEPTAPVSGEPFDVTVAVSAHDAPVDGGTVDLTVGGTTTSGLTLVDGQVVLEDVVSLAGLLEVTATYSGTAAITGSEAVQWIQVRKREPVLTLTDLPWSVVYGTPPLPFEASTAVGPAPLVEVAGPCHLDEGLLHITGVGECVVTVEASGDAETYPAHYHQPITVSQRAQEIELADLPPMVYGQEPVALTPVSSAGLPVTLTAVGACAVVDGALTATAAGLCTVTASQPGDANTLPAADLVRTTTVDKRPQVVTLTGLPGTITGAARIPVTATSEFDLPVTLAAEGACAVVDGVVSVVATGACTVTATAAGDDVTEPGSAAASALVVAGPVTLQATLEAEVGDAVGGLVARAHGTGLRPGTDLTVEVHSTPTRLDVRAVAFDGEAAAWGNLPILEPGTHRVVAEGVALDGSAVVDVLYFGVADDGTIEWIGTPPALPSTGAPAADAALLAGLWVFIGAALVLARRVLRPRRGGATG